MLRTSEEDMTSEDADDPTPEVQSRVLDNHHSETNSTTTNNRTVVDSAAAGPGLALPLLGHLLWLKRDPRKQFAAWRRQYGDVFCLYLGSQLVVVLNGHPVIRGALVKHADTFPDRPHFLFAKFATNSKGIVDTSGLVWNAQRKVSLEILRELGMGKNILEEKIQEEVNKYVKVIAESQGQSLDLTHLTQVSVSNNICAIVLGTRFHYDDDNFQRILKVCDDLIRDLGAGLIVTCYLPVDFFKTRCIIYNTRFLLTAFIKPFVDDHIRRYDGTQPNDFMDAYIREAHQHCKKQSGSPDINDTNLLKLVFDLFIGGTETTSSAILWTLVYFLHHPDIQDKCYEEIHRVVGTERAPTIHDRPELVYLEATIMEVLRHASILPFSVPHCTARDVKFDGYVIPKDTFVIPNLDSVLSAPDVWGDPEKFRPERFIGEDGKLIRPEEFVPFSPGRRVCLGETLARMELFLYLSTLIHNFRFLPAETRVFPSLKRIVGATYSPHSFKVRAVPRECSTSGKSTGSVAY